MAPAFHPPYNTHADFKLQLTTRHCGSLQSINAAAADVQDAKIGWGTKPVAMNRNRHTKIEPKPVDTELGVMRLDDLSGKPIAIVVNYAAHPTMLEAADLRFSAEWPGAMMNAVITPCDSNSDPGQRKPCSLAIAMAITCISRRSKPQPRVVTALIRRSAG